MTGKDNFILFDVAGTTYALHSRDVMHVEMMEHVTAVPNAPRFIDGVIFSRGQVVPAVNLRARFGFERAPFDVRTRLVVVQSQGRQVGLVVDTAREFLSLDAAVFQPPASGLGEQSGRYLAGVANVSDRLILLLDLDAVLNTPDEFPVSPGPSEVEPWQAAK
jgi:purine-binding chemotaxis protein CheW